MICTARLEVVRDTLARLTARYPWLGWVKKWGISTGSLLFGVLTLLVFRRGMEYFPWFVGYLLLLWLAGVAFAEVRHSLAARGRRAISMVVDYTVQTLFHGLLLVLLPIYYASTTLASPNVSFLVMLAAATLVSTIDPWYQAITLRCRWMEVFLIGLGLFASLNVTLPLLHVPTTWALILSGIFSLLALAPIFRRGTSLSWPGAFLRAGLWAVVVGLLLWPLRAYIPPVPLQLARATFARSVSLLEPQEPVLSLSLDELRRWGELAAFSAVVAPAGLQESIYHVWRKDGSVVAKIPLSPIRGGRHGGFRTFSRKTKFGHNPTGTWTVDVLTAQEQIIGRIRLTVTP